MQWDIETCGGHLPPPTRMLLCSSRPMYLALRGLQPSSRSTGEVIRPILHQFPPLLCQIAPQVRGLYRPAE